jgi:hypothetical protein
MLQGFANPTLLSLFHDAASVSAEFEELVQGLDEARLSWSPRPGAWSIAQCLEHLTVTDRAAQRSIGDALRRARRGRRSERPLRPSPVGSWLISNAGPNGGRRMTAPARLAPPELPDAGALERFLASQRRLLDAIHAADGFDINRIVLAAPINRLLPLSLGEVLAITIAHSRRHLEQARRVRNDLGFPAATPGAAAEPLG